MCVFKKRKAKKQEETKAEENKKVKAKEENVEPKKEVKDVYHVSQNKDENSEHFKEWRVRKEGSDKTIKFFKTQKEAIDFANSLSKEKDTGGVKVHKVSGQIRKQ